MVCGTGRDGTRSISSVSRQVCTTQGYNRQPERVIDQTNSAEPPAKKKKRFGQEYESGELSDEYGETEDEVDKYLSMQIAPELILDNPLVFWKENQINLPMLSKLAE
jgi:hypothetical protein